MTKAEELLKVLDLPEDEQTQWMYELQKSGKYGNYDWRFHFFADLAFRLRDETIEKDLDWDDAMILVWEKLERPMKYQTFCKYYAQPIHWIIAALIAKAEKP